MNWKKYLPKNNTPYPELTNLDDLVNKDDKKGDRYWYISRESGADFYPILYINGSFLEGDMHIQLIEQYNKEKLQYKNDWIQDVSNIDINTHSIIENNIPCMRVILNDSHQIAEILFAYQCNIEEISQLIQQKHHCKVYFFTPYDSILTRTAKFHRLARRII